MQAYRQAAKLVPDIEFRAYKLQQQRYQQQQRQALVRGHRLRSKHTLKHITLTCCAAAHYTASASSKTASSSPLLLSTPQLFSFHPLHLLTYQDVAHARDGDVAARHAEENAEVEDIVESLSRMTLAVQPRGDMPTGGHISQLPREVLLHIFADTVRPLGDTHSIGQIAGVCRYFFMLVQDDRLWTLVAQRLHRPCPKSCQPYSSWRELYFDMPRPLWHGVYVSKLSYVRPGEQVGLCLEAPVGAPAVCQAI